MKRYLLLSTLLFGVHCWTQAQYQFEHVEVIESHAQGDLIVSHQAIDKTSDERVIAGVLPVGTFDFDPSANATELSSAALNKVLFVTKYSSNGELIWAHRLVASDNGLKVTDIKINSTGDIFLSIYSYSIQNGNTLFLNPNTTAATHTISLNRAAVIVKYDKNFNYLWSKVFESEVANDNIRLTLRNTGVVISTPTINVFDLDPDPTSTTSFGAAGSQGIGLSYLDESGVFIDGAGLEGASSNQTILDLASDGSSIYLAGHMGNFSSASIDLDPGLGQNLVTGNKAFIAKYDDSFNFLQKVPLPLKRFDRKMEIQIVNSNQLYVSGSFNGTKDFGGLTSTNELVSNGLTDLFIVQYDGNLDFQWGTSWGGTDDEAFLGADLIGSSLVVQGSGSETVTFGMGGVEAKLNSGSYVISISSSGNFNWYKDFKNSDLSPSALNSDSNLNLYPVGSFINSTIDFDPNDFFTESHTAGTTFDLYLSKFTSCTPFQKTITLQGCPGESFIVDETTYTEDKSIYGFASATNGCDSLILTNIQFYAGSPMAASASNMNPSDCGLLDGSVTITASGGSGGYFYSLDGITFQLSNTFSNLSAGRYHPEIKDTNGCSVVLTETLKDPVENSGFELDPSNPLSITNATCAGAADGTAVLNFLNFIGNQVDYSLNGGTFIPLASTTFDNLGVGDYTLDLRTIDGCVQPLAFSITEPEPLSFSITNTTNASCLNTADGTIELIATGGTPSYSYSTDDISYQVFSAAETTTVGSVESGNVVVYVKDANGCTTSIATVVGVDVDNLAPSFTSSATINVDENVSGTFYTALATDNCGIDAYSIIGGVDQLAFTLSGSGELGFVNPPDFESPADVGADNTYDIIVEAIDPAGNTVNLNIEISVNDLIEPIVWSGAVDADWGTSGNWSDESLPTVDDIVSIPTTVTNMPVVSGDYAVDDIIIASGAEVTITKESSLAILGTFSGAGTVTASRNTTGSSGYSILGSPLSDTDLTDLNADFLYDYDGTNYFSPTGPMAPGKGYFFAYHTVSPEVTLTGPPNHGTVSIAVSTSGDAFNLVANPYLAAIDRASFVAANTSAIDGNIWLWNDGGSNAGANRGGDYILINNMGVASTLDLGDGIAGSKTLPTTNTPITSFQGFLVSATANASIAFEPTMQTSAAGSNADGNFYRKADEEYAIIKLSLSNDENYNETLVGLVEGATIDHDYALDGAYRSVNPDFSFYTKMGDHKMAIQALPDHLEILEVPLGIEVRSADTYELAVESLTNIEATRVSLQNELTGEVTKLSDGVALKLTAGLHEEYSLIFQPSEVLSVSKISALQVSGTPKNLILETQLSGIHQTAIFDLSGKKYFEDVVNFESGKAEIATSLSSQTVYLIKVNSQSVKFILQ